MTRETQDDLICNIAALMMFGMCVFAYYFLFRFTDFPTTKVLVAIPIAFVIWLISALTDPIKYKRIGAFTACMIFGTTVMIAAQIMFIPRNG